MNRIRKFTTSYSRSVIYKAIIAPNYEYCNTILINLSEKNIDLLQKTQNRAMIVILGVSKFTPIKEMLNALQFMNIRQRIRYNTCILVYKMKNNLVPKYVLRNINFIKEKHNYNTRNRENIEIRRTRTVIAHKSVVYVGYQMFNELPNELKSVKKIHEFKRCLKLYIKDWCLE